MGDRVGPEKASPEKAKPEKGDKAGTDKGRKKAKQAKHRVKVEDDLSRISEALRELRGRVSDLHTLYLDREGRTAGLAARMETLGSEQARTREVTGALDVQVGALGAKVDALRAEAAVITDTLADLAVEPDRDTALFALEDRIQEAEETLAGLRALAEQQQMTETTHDALKERLDGLGQELGPLAERLASLEGRVAQESIGGLALSQLEQGLGTLSASVDERTGAIERDLATLRDQNKRWREAERAWAEERLNGVRQGLVGGIALLALLLMGGFVATWWHGERQLDLIAARIAAVERDAGERRVPLVAPTGPSDERLGLALSELGTTMQGIQETNAELGAQLAALSAASAAARESEPATGAVSGDPSLADLLMRLRALEEGRYSGAPANEGSSNEAGRAETETRAETPAPLGSAPSDQAQSQVVTPVVDGALTDAVGDVRQGIEGEREASDGPQAQPAMAPAADPMPVPAPPVDSSSVQEPVDAAPTSAAPVAPPDVPLAATAERYTLQLIGFRSEASIAPFAREHDIVGQARWSSTPGKGRDWYLVFLGDYASHQEAQEALAGLSPDLKNLSPLVRSLPDGAQPVTPE